jgi:hypothetical protein
MLRAVPIGLLTGLNIGLLSIWWVMSFLVLDHSSRYAYPSVLIGGGSLGLALVPYFIVKNEQYGWHGFAYALAYALLLLSAAATLEVFKGS